MMIAEDNFYVMEGVIFSLGDLMSMGSVMAFLLKKVFLVLKLFHFFHQTESKLIKLQREDLEVSLLLSKVMMFMNGVL
jgi:hypothetical protein